MTNLRIGIGYDVHKLVPGRKLIIGGVSIDYRFGAEGFSDADVLIHAISDALLGAATLGDIGHYFPDTDEKNLNLSGLIMLKEVVNLLSQSKYSIENIDSTVILQSPKISDHIPLMRKNISEILKVDVNRVSIKATTTEKLGFIGRNEGIAAEAIVLISSIK